jgi:hypothetical protein
MAYIVQWAIDDIIANREKVKLYARACMGYYGFRVRNLRAVNMAIFKKVTNCGYYLHQWGAEGVSVVY